MKHRIGFQLGTGKLGKEAVRTRLADPEGKYIKAALGDSSKLRVVGAYRHGTKIGIELILGSKRMNLQLSCDDKSIVGHLPDNEQHETRRLFLSELRQDPADMLPNLISKALRVEVVSEAILPPVLKGQVYMPEPVNVGETMATA